MSILRVLGERLLLFLLLIARIALMATGLAAVAGIFAFGSFIKAQGTSSVVQTAWGWMQATGGLFLAAGVLLFVFRDWIHIPRSGTSGAPPPAWLPAVAVCLVAQIGATLLFSGNLVQLWQDAIPALERAGVFQEARSGGEMSSVILLPVIAALFVPMVEAAAAVTLTVAPLLLLVLFLTKSRAFPKSFVLTAFLQATLVAGSFLAANAFAILAGRILALTTSGTPAEVKEAFAGLEHIQAVIGPTARTDALLVIPAIIWIPAMMFSRRVEPAFEAGSFDLDPAERRRGRGPGNAA